MFNNFVKKKRVLDCFAEVKDFEKILLDILKQLLSITVFIGACGFVKG